MSKSEHLDREERRQFRRHLIIWGFIASVIFGLIFGARPLVRHWRAKRAEDSLSAGVTAMQKQNWSQASIRLQQAARDAPQNPDVIRAVADYQIGTGDDPLKIARTLQHLIDLGHGSHDDHFKLAKAHLQRGDIAAAQSAINAVPPESRTTLLASEVETDLLLKLDRLPEAVSRIRSTLEEHPDDADASFKSAALDLLHGGRDTGKERARTALMEFSRSGSSRALVSMRLLLQDAGLTAPDAEEISRLAAGHRSDAGGFLRHSALAALMRLRPGQRAEILATEARRSESLDVDGQLAYARFLAAVGEPPLLLDFLSKRQDDLARDRPGDFWNLSLEGLAQQRRWPLVRTTLTQLPPRTLDAVTLHLWHACVSAELDHDRDATRAGVRSAFKAAGTNLTSGARVAVTAARLGLHDAAADFFEALSANAPTPGDRVDLLEKAFAARLALRETTAMVSLARKLSDLTPGHDGNLFRAEYLALLSGAPADAAAARLINTPDPSAADPAATARRKLLWCMIYQRRNQTGELRHELKDIESAMNWPPGPRAVISSIIASTGDLPRAQRLAEGIPASSLLNEEAAELAKLK